MLDVGGGMTEVGYRGKGRKMGGSRMGAFIETGEDAEATAAEAEEVAEDQGEEANEDESMRVTGTA
jgi:hypothetical protein